MAKPAAKNNVLRFLESRDIRYTHYLYDTDDGKIDAVSVAEKIGRVSEEVFKTLVTRSDGPRYYVVVVPGCCELDLKKAAKAAGEKSVEMLPSKELLPLTGYIHGGCSPIGMKKLFPTFVDETAQLYETICVSAGRVGENLSVNPDELLAAISANYADLTR